MNLDPVTLEAAKSAASALMKPIIEKSLATLGKIPGALLNVFEGKFSSYMESQYERHAYLNTLVLGEQKNLKDLYIPLTVIPSTNGSENRNDEIKLDCFHKSFLQTHNRVLITDTAGMGKSTLMKFLFLECLNAQYAIPIFVELRHLSQNKTIFDLIEQQLNLGTIQNEHSYFSQEKNSENYKRRWVSLFSGWV